MKKILITGAAGCVGHYVCDLFINNPDFHLYLLVRNLKKLKFDPKTISNLTIIHDDLKNIANHKAVVKDMDYVIHIAADWGGNEGNFDYSLDLFKMLDPRHCQKVIYFSTASILDQDNQPAQEAEKFGTHYIRSKYRLLRELPKLPIYPRIKTLYPTWVLGGDKNHPYSHAAQGIVDLEKWLWLLRFFTLDTKFHFIHARDLALLAKYLLQNEVKENSFVAGNKPYSASEFLREICAYFQVPVYFQASIPLSAIRTLAFLSGHKLHPWDNYCLERKYFTYKTVNTATFGLPTDLSSVPQILKSLTSK